MSRSSFLRNGLNWAKSSGRNGPIFCSTEDVSNMFPDSRKKRKRSDSQKEMMSLIGAGDLMGVDNMFAGSPSPTVIASEELHNRQGSTSFGHGVTLKTELPCISITNPLSLNCSNMGVTEKAEDAKFEQDVAALFQPAPISPPAFMGSSSQSTRVGIQGPMQSGDYSGHVDGFGTATLGERRDRKNFKERKRRQTMKDKFEELTTLLHKSKSLAVSHHDFAEKKAQKMKKMDVLSEAIMAIKDLQEEVQTLKVERYRYASLLGQVSEQNGLANQQGLLRVSGGMHAQGLEPSTAQPMLMSGTS